MKKLGFFALLFISFLSFSQEICNNAIDDDGDGLIDLNDPDCACSSNGNEPLPSSMIVNHSFEQRDCCPVSYGNISCATNWSQGTAAGANFLNTCGFVGPFVNTNLFPFPQGNGAADITITSDFKQYVGTCLNTPLTAGEPYTLKFQIGMTMISSDGTTNCTGNLNNFADSLDIVIYGATTCGNLNVNTFDCPTAASALFSIIGTKNISVDTNGYQWVSIQFTPTSAIQEIMIGTDCIMPTPWPSSQDVATSGCAPHFVIDNLILNEREAFDAIQIGRSGTHCEEDVVLSAAHPNLNFGSGQWYLDGVALVGQFGNNLNVSNGDFGGGVYTYQFEVGPDCFKDTITVEDPDNLFLLASDTLICRGDVANLFVQGNAVTYTWDVDASYVAVTGQNATVQPMNTRTYKVKGVSVNDCVDSVEFLVEVASVPENVIITSSPLEIKDLGTFSVTPLDYEYTWSFPNGSQEKDTSEATYNFASNSGFYTVLLKAETDSGCVANYAYNVEIKAVDELAYYVPNAFSPNGNEFNETFKPVLSPKIDAYDYHFWIFDRKGDMIFESLDPQIGWDGTYKNRVLASGIYSWKLVVGFKNDAQKIDEKGFVFLAK